MAAMTARDAYTREIEKGLHDLCQPVTTLQCRLELGRMAGDSASLLEAVEGGLLEMRRIFEAIDCFRERMQSLGLNGEQQNETVAARAGDASRSMAAGDFAK
jgi:hypothetical protein